MAQRERASAPSIEGTSIRRNDAEAVTYGIGQALSVPSQFVVMAGAAVNSVGAYLLDKSVELFNKGGAAAFFGAILVFLSAILRAICGIAYGLTLAIDLPARAIRGILDAIGRATTSETPVARAEANFVRVPPAGWPRLPANADAETAARRWIADGRPGNFQYDAIIVPGKGPSGNERLSDEAKERLDQAAADLRAGKAPFIIVSGGNVHPANTPYNEAYEMRAYLLSRGVRPDQILVEPFAEHSTTNLRNSGRLMRSLGLESATIVSSSTPLAGQTFYFQTADSPFFGLNQRSLIENGTTFGTLAPLDHWHTEFRPSDSVDLVQLRPDGTIDPRDP